MRDIKELSNKWRKLEMSNFLRIPMALSYPKDNCHKLIYTLERPVTSIKSSLNITNK